VNIYACVCVHVCMCVCVCVCMYVCVYVCVCVSFIQWYVLLTALNIFNKYYNYNNT